MSRDDDYSLPYFNTTGLSYDYIAHLKTPDEMGASPTYDALGANSNSIGNYIKTILNGGGGPSYTDATKTTYTDNLSDDKGKTRHALGNRYLINWGKCKKFNCTGANCKLDKAKLVDNIPKGNQKGLLFGVVENVLNMIPLKYLDAFDSENDRCFPCEVKVTDNRKGTLDVKKQVWVSADDWFNYKCGDNWPEEWDQTNSGFKKKNGEIYTRNEIKNMILSPAKAKSAEVAKETESFLNMFTTPFMKANELLAHNDDVYTDNLIKINDPFGRVYTLGVGLLLVYIFYENLKK
jgi:hypothetical protein